MAFEAWVTPPYESKPNEDALKVQRERYIVGAIESVLSKQKKEVLRHPGRHFITMVQEELLRQSQMGRQAAASPKDVERARTEFAFIPVSDKVFDFFRVKPYDYDALEEKLKNFPG